MQNLRYYCRQRIEAYVDKQCKFGCIYQVSFGHIIVQSASKIFHDSLSNLKITEMKELHVIEPL